MKVDDLDIEINVVPNELWGFFNFNKAKLKSKMVCIASNPKSQIEIYLTEEYSMPSIIVFEDENQIYKEPCSSPRDAEFTLKDIYQRFLFTKKVSEKEKWKDAFDEDTLTQEDLEVLEELTRIEQEDTIRERDDDLFVAFEDFMTIVLDEDAYIMDDKSFADEIYQVMDEVLELIASHDFPVYRPMYLQDESGTDVFVEYPYEDTSTAT